MKFQHFGFAVVAVIALSTGISAQTSANANIAKSQYDAELAKKLGAESMG